MGTKDVENHVVMERSETFHSSQNREVMLFWRIEKEGRKDRVLPSFDVDRTMVLYRKDERRDVMNIRFVNLEDAQAILNIYQYYIKHTEITFEYEVPSVEEFRMRIQEISKDYPYLVMEKEGNVIGYAYAHRLFERKAYDWDVELSQYFCLEESGKGYGTQLFEVLIELLKLQQIHNVYSLITLPNKKSEGLHQKFGFIKTGVYHQCGYKHGKWLDVGIFEKQLMEHGTAPQPWIPFDEIEDQWKEKVMKSIG